MSGQPELQLFAVHEVDPHGGRVIRRLRREEPGEESFEAAVLLAATAVGGIHDDQLRIRGRAGPLLPVQQIGGQ